MDIDFITDRIKSHGSNVAVVTNGKEYTFEDILNQIEEAKNFLDENKVGRNSVVSLLAEFTPKSIAMFLGLIERDAIIVPISRTVKAVDSYIRVSESEYFIDIQNEQITIKQTENIVKHPMLLDLKENSRLDSFFVGYDR